MKDRLLEQFKVVFKKSDGANVYFAPGRVNLIGEHTDYNGGHVFPCALTIGTYAVVRKRDDNKVRLYSDNFKEDGIKETDITSLTYNKEEGWINYPKSIIWAFRDKGYNITSGFDVFYYGNIPNSSGLSSSASIEVLTSVVIRDIFNIDIDIVDIARISRYAENKFIGVNCGILDQFASAMGKEDHAIFLNTNNLQYEYAPIHLQNEKIVIINSNCKRGLVDSEYNRRREECMLALSDLQKVIAVDTLGELTEAQFEEYKGSIRDCVIMKRAKHAVYENQRTIKAVRALKDNDLITFGKLMIESHISLRNDYEVTGENLDTIFVIAMKQEGVLGVRMTGAGFGGCAVAIVKEDKIESFIKNTGDEYERLIGYAADFYVVKAGSGACKL